MNLFRYNRVVGISFLALSVLLAVLPLKGVVNSVKSVLSYVFIPQIRAAHSTQEYFRDSWETTKELLDTHSENLRLKEEGKEALVIKAQMDELIAENEGLSRALALSPQKKWEGSWAKVAYREPNHWNILIVDKGRKDGVRAKGAVLAVSASGQLALAGEVLEEEESTAKVLLINDADFASLVTVEGFEGLIKGLGGNSGKLSLRYIPLGTELPQGTDVLTSRASTIFPKGVLVGKVKGAEKREGMKTSLSFEVTPAVNTTQLREVFILKAEL